MTPQRVKPNYFEGTKENPPGRARHFTTKEQPTIIRVTGDLMLPPISSIIINVIGFQTAYKPAGSFMRSSLKARNDPAYTAQQEHHVYPGQRIAPIDR